MRRRILIAIAAVLALLVLVNLAWMFVPRTLLLIAGIVVVAVLAIAALWLLPKRQVRNVPDNCDKATLENEARKTIAQILGGAAVFLTLYFTAQQVFVTQEAQITDRFTRATDQLGSKKVEVRIGGIYAFRRIAMDSEDDYFPVVGILSTFVREKAPREKSEEKYPPEVLQEEEPAFFDPSEQVPADIAAVFESLADLSKSRDDPIYIDLHGANLEGATLTSGNFTNANLFNTNLQYASFFGTSLPKTSFVESNLRAANFAYANLREADFYNDQVKDANFCGADLREVKHLTERQLSVMHGGTESVTKTILPDGREPPSHWSEADFCSHLPEQRPWWEHLYIKLTQ
jgi:hypothetical protein